jgi:hypothetical protein
LEVPSIGAFIFELNLTELKSSTKKQRQPKK